MTAFKDFHVYKMLYVIRYQKSIDSLLDMGLEYSQIAKILSFVLHDGLVDDADENGLMLTSKGVEMLELLGAHHDPKISSAWILPSEENRIPKINKFGIYLPRKKKNAQ
jgi:hypothetical protein